VTSHLVACCDGINFALGIRLEPVMQLLLCFGELQPDNEVVALRYLILDDFLSPADGNSADKKL
jgi:hypothetical protein